MSSSLTLKQDSFCLAYLETGNATEAYRRSYNTKKMKPETINRKAKALIDNGKIAARLAELRKPVVEAAQITLATHLRDLKKLRDAAAKKRQYAAAISAEVSRGRVSGLYVEKLEHTGKDGAPLVAAPAVLNITIGKS